MKKFGFLIIMFSALLWVNAQENGSTLEQPVRKPVETPWEHENIGDFSNPVPLAFLKESDIAWAKTIWRVIDLREKLNHPLYFPEQTQGTWRSLARVIYDAVDIQNPDNENALPVYMDEFLCYPQSKNQLKANITETKEIADIDVDGEVIGTKIQTNEMETSSIYYYHIKEVWFFNKRTSKLECQIMEITPMYEIVRENSSTAEEYEGDNYVQNDYSKRPFGYINYAELRPYLAKQDVFNVKNSAQKMSFDDLLTHKRQFISVIYKEENVYDRHLVDYIANPRDQTIKSDEIINGIRRFEHDLWQF